jgi:hypothetical protein
MTGEQLYVLYTYQTVNGHLECHAYGADDARGTSKQIAHGKGIELAELAAADGKPEVGYMVLPLEGLPE